MTTLTINTTGADGDATGSKRTERRVRGFLTHVRVEYHEDAPASTIVKLEEVNGRVLLELPAGNTNGDYYPSVPAHDSSGDETEAFTTPYIESILQVTISDSDALNPAVTVKIQATE